MTDFHDRVEFFSHRPDLFENDLVYAIRNRNQEIIDRLLDFTIAAICAGLEAYPPDIFTKKM